MVFLEICRLSHCLSVCIPLSSVRSFLGLQKVGTIYASSWKYIFEAVTVFQNIILKFIAIFSEGYHIIIAVSTLESIRNSQIDNTVVLSHFYGLPRYFGWQSNSTKLDSLVPRHALPGFKIHPPAASRKTIKIGNEKIKQIACNCNCFRSLAGMCAAVRYCILCFSFFICPCLAFLMRKWFHKLFAGVVYFETSVTVGPRGMAKKPKERTHPFPSYYFSCQTFRHLKLSVCDVFILAKGKGS